MLRRAAQGIAGFFQRLATARTPENWRAKKGRSSARFEHQDGVRFARAVARRRARRKVTRAMKQRVWGRKAGRMR